MYIYTLKYDYYDDYFVLLITIIKTTFIYLTQHIYTSLIIYAIFYGNIQKSRL